MLCLLACLRVCQGLPCTQNVFRFVYLLSGLVVDPLMLFTLTLRLGAALIWDWNSQHHTRDYAKNFWWNYKFKSHSQTEVIRDFPTLYFLPLEIHSHIHDKWFAHYSTNDANRRKLLLSNDSLADSKFLSWSLERTFLLFQHSNWMKNDLKMI